MKNALPALHVLVVEDDPDIQTAMCCILEDEGHHADCAESVEAGAAKLLGTTTYDVIVLDWMLRGQTAEELLPTIMTLDPVPPAILYSAAPSAAALAKKWSITFVSKPFDVRALLTLLAGCVAARTSVPSIPT